MNNLSDKIYSAAQQFQKAIEDMGATEVTIMYCYNNEKSCYTGGAYQNIPLAIGALELMKHDLLNP